MKVHRELFGPQPPQKNAPVTFITKNAMFITPGRRGEGGKLSGHGIQYKDHYSYLILTSLPIWRDRKLSLNEYLIVNHFQSNKALQINRTSNTNQ
jgi:hypothetical protein